MDTLTAIMFANIKWLSTGVISGASAAYGIFAAESTTATVGGISLGAAGLLIAGAKLWHDYSMARTAIESAERRAERAEARIEKLEAELDRRRES